MELEKQDLKQLEKHFKQLQLRELSPQSSQSENYFDTSILIQPFKIHRRIKKTKQITKFEASFLRGRILTEKQQLF
ncbi:hypothetical protein pb186bvf_006281 [Paramecium bursaria]